MELKVNREIESDAFQIMLWQRGGFTGLKTGFTLSPAGEVTHWQQLPGQADSVLWIAKGYASEINNFRNQLDESGALDKRYSEFGNMTFGIDYKTNEKKYTWTWNQLKTEDSMLGKLQNWYQNTLKFCQSLESK